MVEVVLDKISKYTKTELYARLKDAELAKLSAVSQARSYKYDLQKADDEIASLQAWRIMLSIALVAVVIAWWAL